MADEVKPTVSAGREEVAYKLFERIISSESQIRPFNRARTLDLYAECLDAASGTRSRSDKQSKV